MNKTSYSQILDAVAGDHIPNDLDLAPTIIARIQKGKGFRMQPKTKFVSAILLVVIAFVVLFYTVPAVTAAFERWFGYVPGVGLVQRGTNPRSGRAGIRNPRGRHRHRRSGGA